MKYFLLLSCVVLIALSNHRAAPLQEVPDTYRYQVYVNNVCFYMTRDENGYFTFSHVPFQYPISDEASIEAYTVLYYEYISQVFYDYGAEHDD